MLTPYNYTGTNKTTTKSTTGGSLKPYTYAPYTPPAAPAPVVKSPDFISSVIGGAKTFGTDVYKSLTAPAAPVPSGILSEKTPTVGGNIAVTTINSYANALKDAGNRLQNLQQVTTDKKSTTLQKGIALGDAGIGGLNAFFAPLTAAGAGAAQIPVLGHVAQGINNLFSAIGTGGADVGEGALQSVPGLSQDTKDQLSPLVKEVFALGAQIAAGKAGVDVYENFKAKTKELTHTLADKVPADVQKNPAISGEPAGNLTPFDYSKVKVPVSGTSVETPVQIANRYTPPDQLPTIDVGTVPKSELPTIQTEAPKSTKLGDLTIEPIKQARPSLQESFNKLNEATLTGDSTTAQATLKDIQTKVTELATKVDQQGANTFQSRVFERMKAENPDVLTGDATATHIKLAEDAARAVDLIAKDKQAAFDVAMGAKSSPDITSTATNIALAEKALQEGNHELYSRLVQKRSLDQTRRGQEIVSERGSITDNSTSRYVKELVASRLDQLGAEYLGGLKERITRVSNKKKAINKVDADVKSLETKIKTKKLDTKTAVALLDKLTCV